MRKNINNPLPLMAWIRATINNATEKYEVSLYTLFGFSRSHFSSEGPITSNKELIQLKDELHEFFGTLDSMGLSYALESLMSCIFLWRIAYSSGRTPGLRS